MGPVVGQGGPIPSQDKPRRSLEAVSQARQRHHVAGPVDETGGTLVDPERGSIDVTRRADEAATPHLAYHQDACLQLAQCARCGVPSREMPIVSATIKPRVAPCA